MRKWSWVLLVTSIVLCVAVIYINIKYYASVINMGFFGGLFGTVLFLGAYGLLKREKSQRVILAHSGMIALIIIMFVIASPHYTYQRAQQMVVSAYLEQNKTSKVDELLLEHKTIPSAHRSSWLLKKRLYYIGIKDGQQNQMIYYAIDPTRERIVKLDKPYW